MKPQKFIVLEYVLTLWSVEPRSSHGGCSCQRDRKFFYTSEFVYDDKMFVLIA